MSMNKPKLVAERRFGELDQLAEILCDLHFAVRGQVVYVRTFASEGDDRSYANVVRLWEDKLTDGSKVYELHIL